MFSLRFGCMCFFRFGTNLYVCFLSVLFLLQNILFLGLLYLRKFVVCGGCVWVVWVVWVVLLSSLSGLALLRFWGGGFGGCIVHQRTAGLAAANVSIACQDIAEKWALPPNPTSAVFFRLRRMVFVRWWAMVPHTILI